MNKLKIVVPFSILFVLLDQISKYLVIQTLPLYHRINVLPFFDLVHIRNPGVAFGFLGNLPEGFRYYFYAAVLIIALVVLTIFIYNTHIKQKFLLISMSLILSGAVGNSIDRLRLGYVTDFLDFHWFGDPKLHWPPFNVADSCITVGVIFLIINSLFLNKSKGTG